MKSEFLKFSSKRILFSTVVTSVLMAGSPLEVFAADATEVQAVMQTGTVTGQVVDANGEPVIGASILIKGTGTLLSQIQMFSPLFVHLQNIC